MATYLFFKKLFTYQKILVGVLLIGIIGLFNQWLALHQINFGNIYIKIYYILFPTINLYWINDGLNIDIEMEEGILHRLNLLNVFYYFLVLAGAFHFYFSKYQQTRLIRFTLAVFFFADIIGLIYGTLSFILRYNADPLEFYSRTPVPQVGLSDVPLFIFGVIMQLFWLYFFYGAIKRLNADKHIRIVEIVYEDYTNNNSISISNGLRFLHVLIDVVILILIISFFVKIFAFTSTGEEVLFKLANILGEKPAAYLVMIIARTIYYVLFEATFGATPAKFLTGARVIDYEGNHPTISKILGRTLIRFVPLEALSFLWNGKWHDQWSETDVVEEA